MDKKDRQNMGAGLVLLAGIAVGWAVSKLMSQDKAELGDKAKKIKEKIKDMAPDIKIPGSEERQRIEDMFEGNKDLMSISKDIKNGLKDKLNSMRHARETIDRSKYIMAVHETFREFEDQLNLPANQVEKIQRYLENDYDFIKDKLNLS